MSQNTKFIAVGISSLFVGVIITLLVTTFIQEDTAQAPVGTTAQTQELSGAIIAIEPDCEEPRYLNRNDNIGGGAPPTICDAGSFIVLDGGERIQTALTYSPDPFDKHDDSWELAQNVSLTVTESGNPNYYSLDCDICGQN